MHPALVDTHPGVFWLDRPFAPPPRRPLPESRRADLVVVGGGYTGLWAALEAKRTNPDREIVVLEAGTVGTGASGRNGGFADASITHGLANGLRHFPGEIHTLLALGRENLSELLARLDEYNIDADVDQCGQLVVATETWHCDELVEYASLLGDHGERAEYLDAAAVRAEIDSPMFRAGLWTHDTVVTLDPAKLVWGLTDACEHLGVTVHDDTFVHGVVDDGRAMRVDTGRGSITTAKVVVATNAYPSMVRAIGRRVAPVWDYVLMTEPLTPAQLQTIGWQNRQGLSDANNLFHYFRLTRDNRILWGGYDAVYYRANQVGPHVEQRPETFELLARQFFAMFPQLDGLHFSHSWGGPIATTSRFCVTFGTEHSGRLAYAVGYTGLGVGASRFGARVALALLDDPHGDLARLEFVRRRPIPFPPEPFRNPVIQLTRRAIARADEQSGRRGPWLRLLDALGIGFDS